MAAPDPPQPAVPSTMTAARARLAGLDPRRRMAVAATAGALVAAALPPVHVWPILFVSFTAVMWLIEDAPGPRAAAAAGWWFGFGHALAGLYWIGFAFVVDAPQYGWMAPFAVVGMAAWMAVFPALAAAASRLVFARRALAPAGRVVVFAAAWVVAEWLRGWLLTGFPWNLLGTVWTASDAMIQLAALTGVYGLSLLTVFVAAMPATLADADRPGRRRAMVPTVVALAVLGAVWTGGQARLRAATDATVDGVRLRLVQPNIPQALKWVPELRKGHVVKQLEMSRRPTKPGAPPPSHVIWAETSVPFVIEATPGLAEALARAAPPGGTVIVGAPRRRADPAGVWNSLHAIDSDGRIGATYDKFHLVPFGEYVPLRGWLPIGKLTAGRQDFSPGAGLRTLTLTGLPAFSPLICYEVIFPGRVAAAGDRPGWLLNLTNDAWFGSTSGPYQHFAAARLRAAEEGLPLVRVANTGISGIIDSYGRVVRRAGLGRDAVIDGPLPAALGTMTPFARFGNLMTAVIVVIALGIGVLLNRPKIEIEHL